MSNKVSSHLFELIKSLNKSEKRYFKLFSSRHTIGEENGYLKLFDFIDRMDTYQEDLIFMHFKGQALLNKFSITKARLYNNILRSLDSFNANTSHDAQLYRSIHCADILYDKGLYKQCEKLLKSAEKQAKKYERFNTLLEIKQKQKKLIENELYTEIKAVQITKMFEEEKAIIDEIQTYHQLWNVKSLLFQEINLNGNVRNEQDTLKLKELVDRIANINVKNYSTKINYLYNHIHGAYYFSVNDLECSYHHLQANMHLLEDDSTTFKNRPNLYFSVLTNIIYISTRLKKYEEAEEYLLKLKDLSAAGKSQKTLDLDIKYFSSSCSLELFLLIEKGDYHKAEELVPQIEEAYRLYGDHINSLRKAYIDFKVGIIYLSIGEYSKALNWINKVLNESKIDQKQDIFCFAQLINLILHFELDNSRFLPYAINSTKRYLKNKKRIYAFEELFLKLITRMAKSDGFFELEEKLMPIEKELIILKADPKEQVVFEYFDFLTWVQSKLKRKTFLELKKEALELVG
ncbi:MAG: tetratricopeptide (TPR) repeat protein [Crocinitomix sp.]|jgi:tetratricopeptide (TPR) repeat protein